MWVKAMVGNHYGIFEVMGIELYEESDTSYILYGYLPRPVPRIPVRAHESLRDGISHTDYVKIYQFSSEKAAKAELDKIQDFMGQGSTGVYEVSA